MLLFQIVSSGLLLGGHECLCATSQKRHITRIILSTVNCLFANGDVSIRFNGENFNFVLEYRLINIGVYLFFQLQIDAYDGGGLSSQIDASVVVQVYRNTNNPFFSGIFEITIPEDQLVNSAIYQFTYSDADIDVSA